VRCNDVITAVDGRPVRSAEQLTAAIRSHRPGTRVAVTVRRGRRSETLHPVLTHLPAQGGHPAQPHTAFLGVEVQDDTTYTLPFDVHIDVGNIGGPSAGLALTLGLLDTLSGGRLTGGHTVAATGTITPTGQVGPVGGVAQKSVAITRAGARLFLVPPDEYRTALRRVGAGVKVEEVTSLAQALADLRAIGGSVPPATGAGAS
jgi:PDZ domain-containing protein